MAYAAIEPFGGPVDDLRAGLAPAIARNLNRAEGTEPVGPLDFYPWHQKAPEELTREELEARIKQRLLGESNG
jgi:hypothetical protein